MSDHLGAEISVNVGEIPNNPGLKLAARLGIGQTNSGNIKTTLRQKAGVEPEDAVFYLVVAAQNSEGAEDLRNTIQAAIDKLNTGEGDLSSIPPPLLTLHAKSDDQDYEGVPKATLTVSVHDTNTVVTIKPIAQLRETIAANYETASGLAGDVLLKDQEVYLEFDAGKSIGDILHSSKWLEDFFEAISFKLWIHLHPQVFADISGIASNLGAPDNILLALGSLGIFSSAGINLNFKSATELPEDIKSSLRKIESRANFAEIHQKTPAGLKAFFGHFANHGTGNLHLFGSLQTNAVQIDLHIPGLSKFISE